MRPRPPLRPDDRLILVVGLIVLVVLILWLTESRRSVPLLPPAANNSPEQAAPPVPATAPDGSYLFCTWNVENFYDDQDDAQVRDLDEDWFGRNPDLVAAKVRLLADALLLQNDGRGPDILAMVEVESRRCVELLRDELNARLPTEYRYLQIIQRDNHISRHFAPAVLTRLSARDDLTRTFGIRRILEVHLESQGAPLIVLSAHWTSRVTDKTDEKREAYADTLFRAYRRLAADDPSVDILIAGDFNDEPDDPSLHDHLHVVGEPTRVRPRGPFLLDLMEGQDPNLRGTYFHARRWEILDHIVASPGLLDTSGWEILPDTLRTENASSLRDPRRGAPRHFGGPQSQGARGPSDHFAVTVRLKVNPPPAN